MALLTLHEAARVLQGVPRTVPSRDSHKMPDVYRTQKDLQKQALLYDRSKGKLGLRTIRAGKRRRKVYRHDLNRWRDLRDRANGVHR